MNPTQPHIPPVETFRAGQSSAGSTTTGAAVSGDGTASAEIPPQQRRFNLSIVQAIEALATQMRAIDSQLTHLAGRSGDKSQPPIAVSLGDVAGLRDLLSASISDVGALREFAQHTTTELVTLKESAGAMSAEITALKESVQQLLQQQSRLHSQEMAAEHRVEELDAHQHELASVLAQTRTDTTMAKDDRMEIKRQLSDLLASLRVWQSQQPVAATAELQKDRDGDSLPDGDNKTAAESGPVVQSTSAPASAPALTPASAPTKQPPVEHRVWALEIQESLQQLQRRFGPAAEPLEEATLEPSTVRSRGNGVGRRKSPGSGEGP